ncbi:MAG: PAS domain S-box protein [Thermodesulfobacteriota bacterium]
MAQDKPQDTHPGPPPGERPDRDMGPAAGLAAENRELRRSLAGLEATLRQAAELHSRTAEELQENRNRLQLVADAMRESLAVFDAGGRVLFANARAAKTLFGCPPDQAPGRNIAECIPPGQVARLLADYRRVMDSDQPQSSEIMTTVGGQDRWFLNRLFPIRFGPDGAAAVLSISLEITVRKGAEAALAESEERLRAILGSIQAGVLVVDPRDRSIVNANPAACRLMGRAREEVLGRLCHQFICPHEAGRCPVLDLGQKVDASERQLLHASGRSIPVLKTVTRMHLDGREHLLECFMDLSERKRIEAAFQGVAESASDAIYLNVLGPDHSPGHFLDANPAASRMLGYSRDEFLALALQDIVAADVPPERGRRIASELQEQGESLFETVHVARDGRRIPVEIHARVLGQGDSPMVLSVARDVSERKAAEAAASRAREEAEAASRAKSEFLANMSHELRTPLNGVMGMLQLLEDTPLDEEQRQYAGIAMQSARGMLALVNDLLDLSRIEAGRMPIECETLDLRDLLESVCQVFTPPARAKGVALRGTIYPGVPAGVLGDPVRLRQVLFNLVGNAVKFTDSGEVRIAVASMPGPGGCGPPRLFFSVADSGVGMSDEQLSKVFQPFVQVDGSASRRFGGAGLGLAITRRLLGLMGGRLAVDTEPGRGAEFAFTLPLLPAPPGALPCEAPAAPGEARPLRLLLAEDEPVNRLAARLMLERLGHSVVLAADGEEALAALARERFDCVILDISMPVLDGIAVLRRLRRLERETGRARTPVVAMTAHAMAGDRERFLDQGCDGYLAKPVDLEELTRVLAAAAKT